MLLNLTDFSSESLQSQIARQIRAKILTGELLAGTNIPSIRVLARDYHVSVITVQRAYEQLMREDLVHARRGKGFFVSQVPNSKKKDMAKTRLLESITKPISEAFAEGLSVTEITKAVKHVLAESNNKEN